jgi:hypothetical protein
VNTNPSDPPDPSDQLPSAAPPAPTASSDPTAPPHPTDPAHPTSPMPVQQSHTTQESQGAQESQDDQEPRPAGFRASAVTLLATLAGTAIIGIPAGYIWALVAPRALAQVVSRGAANVVNAETTAFIAADAWFVLIASVGGLLTGIAGYLLVVRRRGAPAAVGLILGGLGAAALMWWIGDNYGHAQFQHRLLTDPKGTYLHASLSLGSKGAIVFWPIFAALAIAVPEAIAYFRNPGPSNKPSTKPSPTSTSPSAGPPSADN